MLIWSAGRFVPSGDASLRVPTDGLGADVPLLAKLKGDLDVVGRAAGQRNVPAERSPLRSATMIPDGPAPLFDVAAAAYCLAVMPCE